MIMIDYPSFPCREKKEALREQIRRDMEAFISRGGDIERCSEEDTCFVYKPKLNVSITSA